MSLLEAIEAKKLIRVRYSKYDVYLEISWENRK